MLFERVSYFSEKDLFSKNIVFWDAGSIRNTKIDNSLNFSFAGCSILPATKS